MSVEGTITTSLRSGLPSPSGRRRPTHCSVGGHFAEGSQFASELAQLLLHRLRIVTLIALAPTALFLVLNLLEIQPHNLTTSVSLGLHAIVTALIAWLAVVVWTAPQLSLCTLRKMELALFGSMATFFSWLQVSAFQHTELFDAARCVVDSDHTVEVVRLWLDATAVRWFFLIVIYGVFIPNTWQRCARIAGTAAVAPLVLTPLGAWAHGRLCPDVMMGVLDLAILMGTAFAVAVFGSYRFAMLQREAFQAKQLGQYQLGTKLGAGGMGEVFKAEHVLLRRPCAIKLIRPDQTRDPAVLQRFEREVQAMATLTAPNTVEVFDYGQADDGTFYYVMEYLPGMNLDALVGKHGPLPPERAVHFLRQVCRALREAHAIGLLHRDIKPSNIFACERGGVPDVAKLLDFGLVQDLGLNGDADRLTLQGTVLGSPPYMSPEQAAGRNDIDVRADIYSLGGVGYYLLTGRPPFLRETAMEMLLAHAYEAPTPPSELRPEIPADVEAVILRCLMKKPDERFPDVNAMEKALAACFVAEGWSEEQAQSWWKSVPSEAQTTPAITAVTTTPIG
jgi:tRNA A-37 threonylcarbamoyl transferase component Bud32